MKVVIDIPEDQYRTLTAKTQADIVAAVDDKLLITAIKNGIPIPKGRGGLIYDEKAPIELNELYKNDQEFRDFINYFKYGKNVIIDVEEKHKDRRYK